MKNKIFHTGNYVKVIKVTNDQPKELIGITGVITEEIIDDSDVFFEVRFSRQYHGFYRWDFSAEELQAI